ncbi:MAG: NADH-quinone oxidoreductase subunit L [Planctomycetota bacterium]
MDALGMITSTLTLAADATSGAAMPWWVIAIPFLPLANAALVGLFAAVGDKTRLPAWTTVISLAASFGLTLLFFLNHYEGSATTVKAFDWISIDWAASVEDGGSGVTALVANFAFYFDGLSLLWMLFVTGLGTLIALYASEYMDHDVGGGYCRFFAAFSIFVFSMSCLVMGDNLLLLFLGWEGVGLCSYLLIGYYYKKKAAVDAGRKAFVVNRIGDLGLLMAMFLTFTTFGTLEYAPLMEMVNANTTASGAVLSESWQVWAIPVLIVAGAFGKSAQLFFYVWLPDAMEGPTPVSALIHAATMVTAGVYLVARMNPLFLQDPNLIGLTVVTWGGTITALWSATIAMAQYDIKRIMGYSTVSQLGYMFAGLGFLTSTGGVFHVLTHAFFKATLFLACGAVMHGFAGQLDMRRLSGLWSIPGFKIVVIAMLIGCLNLAGFPFTAGYFSKDMILAEAFTTPDSVIPYSSVAGWILLVTAGLTAYYTFRVFFRVFVGPKHYEPGEDLHGADPAGFHPHGPRWAIKLVLGVLTLASLGAAGLYLVGDHGWAGDMVHHSTADVGALPWSHAEGAEHSAAYAGPAASSAAESGLLFGQDPHKIMYYVSAVVGAIGIGLAAFFHGPKGLTGLVIGGRTSSDKTRMDGLSRAIRPVSTWAERKWLVDELYQFLIVGPLWLVSNVFAAIDRFIVDGIVDGLGRLPRALGEIIRPAQNGVLHGYALRMLGGLAVVLLIVVVFAL